MGQKISDGKAVDLVAPSGQVINDYDMYRIGGWNGAAIGSNDGVAAKTMAFECDPPAIYSIKVPAGISPAVGAKLYWATADNTTFQRGDTNLALTGAAGQLPCFKCISTKNAAGYVQGRILNID